MTNPDRIRRTASLLLSLVNCAVLSIAVFADVTGPQRSVLMRVSIGFSIAFVLDCFDTARKLRAQTRGRGPNAGA
jgi:hypothetical protein